MGYQSYRAYLRSDEVLSLNGVLTQKPFASRMGRFGGLYPDHFLRMMDKSDLAYLIPNDPEDRSLMVERLSHDPVEYETAWDGFKETGNEMSLRFKLRCIEPGIPSWFIARCHRFTMNKRSGLYGVLFAKDASEPRHLALVRADIANANGRMTVRGPFPQRLISFAS